MSHEAAGDARAAILVVDDSSMSRDQLASALARGGFEVVSTASAAEALEQAAARGFDLVLTDIHMPNMDGLELIASLRELPGYERVPVFVLTSDASKEQLAAGRRAGATAWLVKPPELVKLVTAARQAINSSREKAASAGASAASGSSGRP